MGFDMNRRLFLRKTAMYGGPCTVGINSALGWGPIFMLTWANMMRIRDRLRSSGHKCQRCGHDLVLVSRDVGGDTGMDHCEKCDTFWSIGL